MQEFDRLLEIATRLLGPGGCPWDHTQTFTSLQPYVLEEAHEVLEAVDSGEDAKIVEELGDLLYTVVFYAKLAEKTDRFKMEDILKAVSEKLVRRHPHVFGSVKVEGVDEIIQNWEAIKKQEKSNAPPKKILEGMPPTLPTLIKAQKLIRKLGRQGVAMSFQEDATLVGRLLHLIVEAEEKGVDLEGELRRSLEEISL